MNTRPSLADLLKAAVQKANQEQADAKQVERITALVMAQLAKRAKRSKPMSCPNCGEPLPESWRTDDVTSDGDSNDDEDNIGDRPDLPEEFDNRRRMGGLTPDQVRANLNKIRC